MKVVILGAGYGGLSLIAQLKANDGLDVTLVDKNDYHTVVTRLHEAAANNTSVTIPISKVAPAHIKVERGCVQSVDLDQKQVLLEGGTVLTYDMSVIALGSITNFYGIPGMAEHALELKQLQDAQKIFDWLSIALQPNCTGDRTVVIGGAGATGVELATEIAAKALAMSTNGKDGSPLTVYLVEAGPVILPFLDAKSQKKAMAVLQRYGIKVLTEHKIVEVHENSVAVQSNNAVLNIIQCSKVIWTGGVQAPDILQGEKLLKGSGGRIPVDPFLRIPEYPDTFVIGDMALIKAEDGKVVPPTAQHAMQQGPCVARNLQCSASNKKLTVYKPRTLGELVSLGGKEAIGRLYLPSGVPVPVSGCPAHAMKRMSEKRWRDLIL